MRFSNRNFFFLKNKIFTYNIYMYVCLVDSEDMFLVEILADLRKENEEEKIIDNDSILGSQFSMPNNEIKEDNEDEEIEDLNITSLDLSSLSSWNSIITESESKKTEDFKQTKYNVESASRDLPQYDGPSDLNLKSKKQLSRRHTKNKINKETKTCAKLDNLVLYFNNRSMILNEFINIQINFNFLQNQLMIPYGIVFDIKLPKYFIFYQKQTERKCENKHRKMLQTTEKKLSYYRYINIYKLDHQDLDVYDVDEIEHKLHNYKHLKNSIDFENNLDRISYNKLYVINSVLNKLNIPALDGNANTSSDSETDQDITINKEEERVCVYNRLKKRRLELEDPSLQSPHKRRNIIRNVSDEPYTPTKVKLMHSPCSISTKYSPLNIKIVSPKIDRNTKNIKSYNSKSTYNILNRNTQYLSGEEVNNSTSEANQGK